MNHNTPMDDVHLSFPKTLVKAFKIEAQNEQGTFETIYETELNHQRLVNLRLDLTTKAVRFVGLETWGCEKINLFSWDVR